MSASRRIIRLHCSSPPLFFHTLLIISVALSLFHCGIRALQRRRDVWNHWRSFPEAEASHSCVTSATSQPSTTGRDAPQPSDLRGCCVVASATSPGLTSRPSHIAPKYRAASPNLHIFFDLNHSYCLCSKWISVPSFSKKIKNKKIYIYITRRKMGWCSSLKNTFFLLPCSSKWPCVAEMMRLVISSSLLQTLLSGTAFRSLQLLYFLLFFWI